MRIVHQGDEIVGYVNYDGRGKKEVVRILIQGKDMSITTPELLPNNPDEENLIAACFNSAFLKASEVILNKSVIRL
jgi:hypothetical protein